MDKNEKIKKGGMNSKVCSKCRESKVTEEFSKDKSRSDGLGHYCKKCNKKRVYNYHNQMKNRNIGEVVGPPKKKCPRCDVVKVAGEFFKTKCNKDGLYSYCKKCSREKSKDYIKKKKCQNNHILISKKKKCSKCGKIKSSKRFCNRVSGKNGLCSICRECSNRYLREYYKNMINREDKNILVPKKKKCPKCGVVRGSDDFYRYRGNKDGLNVHCRLCVNRQEKNRKENNLNYKITVNLRSSLRRVLKLQNAQKSYRIMEIVGCSVENLVNYLKSKMLLGMTWDNYGEWHIDHIRPCVAFDLTDSEEQKRCFNYRNLQPLWAKDNSSKNSYYNGKLIRRQILND